MSDYTPTTAETRSAVMAAALPDRHLADEAGLAFDRWLADLKAAVWDEGYGDDVAANVPRVNPYRREDI